MRSAERKLIEFSVFRSYSKPMLRFFLPRFHRLLPCGLALLFALQVASIVPLHHFHGAETAARKGAPEKSSVPESCRCDFCLAFSALDHVPVAPPLVTGLAETAFAVVAAYPSFEYLEPVFFSRARGPPVLAA